MRGSDRHCSLSLRHFTGLRSGSFGARSTVKGMRLGRTLGFDKSPRNEYASRPSSSRKSVPYDQRTTDDGRIRNRRYIDGSEEGALGCEVGITNGSVGNNSAQVSISLESAIG